jgi:glycosyltransferase involved in cell wall biosynthesis
VATATDRRNPLENRAASASGPIPSSLEGVRVLVDAFNLGLVQGTGIKTYTLSLLGALREMRAEVGLLFSRPHGPRHGPAVLSEISFFDTEVARARFQRLRSSLSLARAAAGLPLTTAEIPLGFVVGPDVPDNARILTRDGCFEVSFLLDRLAGRSLRLSTPARFDLWHATYPIPIQIRGAKSVLTIHDAIPFRLPYTTLDRKVEQFRRHQKLLRSVDLVVTPSEATRQDLLDLFDADPDRIVVTHQPVTLRPLGTDEQSGLERALAAMNLRPQGYLLFVGAIEPKKNVRRLIDAFLQVDTDLPLVVVGKKAWLWQDQLRPLEQFSEDEAKKRVRLLDYVDQRQLRSLYAGALGFVFPSLYEGFGLPPLEAMVFGVPVITSNVSSLPEICGDAALYVDPYSTDEIGAAIERVLGDAALRERLGEAGRRRAAGFDMAHFAQRLAGAYQKVL